MSKEKEVLHNADKRGSFLIECKSLDELPSIAKQILDMHPDKRVFALFGVMGAGKTTLIKSFCKALNVNDSACSPSFGIVHHYLTDEEESVFHFDFYRINRVEEAFDIGYEEYLYSGEFCFMEWPEIIEHLLPEDCCRVYLEDRNGKRFIKI